MRSWQSTPFIASCAVKQRGADCIGFVAAVVDELYRREFKVNLKSMAGVSHESQKFLEFHTRARTLWPVEPSSTVDCGDIILSRPKSGHAHIYITGAEPYTAWHCQFGESVAFTGFQSLGENLTFYKLLNKELWI